MRDRDAFIGAAIHEMTHSYDTHVLSTTTQNPLFALNAFARRTSPLGPLHQLPKRFFASAPATIKQS